MHFFLPNDLEIVITNQNAKVYTNGIKALFGILSSIHWEYKLNIVSLDYQYYNKMYSKYYLDGQGRVNLFDLFHVLHIETGV